MKMRIEEPTKVGKSVTSPILDFKRYGLKNVLKERSHSLSRRAAAMNFIGRWDCQTTVRPDLILRVEASPRCLKERSKELRLPAWLCCFGYQQAAGNPKTQFLLYVVKILPTCYLTSRVHIIESQSGIPPLHSFWGLLYTLMITSKIAFFCLNNNGLPDSTFQIQRFVKKFAK